MNFPWLEILLMIALGSILYWKIQDNSKMIKRNNDDIKMEYLIDSAIEHFSTEPDIDAIVSHIKEQIAENDGGSDKWQTYSAKPELNKNNKYVLLPWNTADVPHGSILKGEVDMLVNYALEPEEVEAGYILTCQSFPKTEKIIVDFDAL